MLKTTTTDLDAEAWADAQVRRHTSWADTILDTGPHCTGMCRQGRALCVHPVECGVQRPVADDAQLAPAEELQADQMGDINAGVWRWALISAAAVALVVTLVNCAPKP